MTRNRRSRLVGPETDLRRTVWQIGLQTGAVLVVCLLVVGAVAYVAVVHSGDRQLAETLDQAVQSAQGRGDMDGDNDRYPTHDGVYVSVYDGRGCRGDVNAPPGLVDCALMATVATSGGKDQRTVRLPTGAYEILTVVRGDDVVQAAANRIEQHQERERLLAGLGLAGGAGLVLATLAAALLARRAVRPMAQALEMQRRFVADAGHELRTPLTLLSTRAQLLARRVTASPPVGGDQGELITRDAAGIVADTTALTAILEELLLAADVRTPIPSEPVDLRALVGAAVASIRAEADRTGIALTMTDDHHPAVIHAGAPTALSRSVTALIDNALGHARHEVTVSVTSTSRDVTIDIVDDGPGLPDETLPRMFTRFASDRPSSDNPDERRHFGLGLALVSEIASRHGGSVTATNRQPPVSGAILRLTLPR